VDFDCAGGNSTQYFKAVDSIYHDCHNMRHSTNILVGRIKAADSLFSDIRDVVV
jgi:hypothetical protein